MEFKKGDKVKLNDINLKKLGYDVEGFLNANLQDVNFGIDHIYPKDIIHYYKEELLKSGLYSRDTLNDKHVYSIYCHIDGRSISCCVIDDDMILVESYKPTPIEVPEDIIDNILKAYAQYHIDYDLKTDVGDILNDINNGNPNKKTLLDIISDVHQLPCIDNLYDKYMSKEANEWLSNNEDFSLEEYLNLEKI